MANAKPSSLLDKRPKTDAGKTLDSVAGKEITITGFQFLTRNGKNDAGEAEEYELIVFSTDTDAKYHTSSKSIREYFASIADDVDELLPAVVTFDKVRSTANPSRSYWDIVA